LVIQNYLINQGIEATRMQIKAWGGKRPIYDEDHTLAKANVRVEIEILED
jgi:outer membrane protein OmpA-like peptidoglycan-associated protein